MSTATTKMEILQASDKLAPLLDLLNSGRKIGTDGTVSYVGIDAYHISTVLRSFVLFPFSLPAVTRNTLISEALFDQRVGSHIDMKSLRGALHRAFNTYEQRPPKDYYMLSSWSIQRAVLQKRRWVLNGVRIAVDDVPRRFSQQSVHDLARKELGIVLPATYTPVLAKTSGRCIHSAFERASECVDVLRGCMNFCLNRRTHQRWSQDRHQPVNLIVPGPIHTLHLSNGTVHEEGSYWHEPRYRSPVKCLPKAGYDKIHTEFTTSFARLRRSRLREHAHRLIINYCHALDGTDWDASFLELWQALELAVGSEQQGMSHEQVIKRALFLWQDISYAAPLLDHLRNRRNTYVHHATQHPDIETLIYQLKRFVEQVIHECIFNNTKSVDAEELIALMDIGTDLSSINKRRSDIIAAVARLDKAEAYRSLLNREALR